MADYQKHGRQTLDRTRKEDPTAYIRMIASLVPKQVEKTPNPLEHFTDEELDQLETYLESIAKKGESGVNRGVDRTQRSARIGRVLEHIIEGSRAPDRARLE